MIVVDTNVLAYLYLSDEHSERSERLLALDSDWVAPVLWRSEFRSILALYLRKGLLGFSDALEILREAEDLLANGEYQVSSAQVMSLVNASDCSAYDCEFVALAQYLGLPLITADQQILRSFPGIATSIDAYLAHPAA
jgi:predicted nucleic acid-binding protein